jgi:ribosome-associated toxin RatA of RatAB toxin-antitoxin module
MVGDHPRMSKNRATHSEIAHATAQECFDAITDFESYPEWNTGLQECRVLEHDEQGRGSLVESVLDLKLKTIRYTLRYDYSGAPTHLRWRSVAGDVKRIDGEYTFEQLGDGTTRMTYSVDVDFGMFVPGPVKNMLKTVTVRNAVRELKARVEALKAA